MSGQLPGVRRRWESGCWSGEFTSSYAGYFTRITMIEISASTHDWLNTALVALAILVTLALAALRGRPARLLYSISSTPQTSDWRTPGPRRCYVTLRVENLAGRGLLWIYGQKFRLQDFNGPMRAFVHPGWFVAQDPLGCAYPDGGPNDVRTRRGATIEIFLPNLSKGASYEVSFVLEEIPDLPSGQRLSRWLRDLVSSAPIGRPHVDSAVVAGFRKRPGPIALLYISFVPLLGSDVLLSFAAIVGPGGRAPLAYSALALAACAVILAIRSLLAIIWDTRTQIRLARRYGVAAAMPGLFGPGPSSDFLPILMIGVCAYYRWIGHVYETTPQMIVASWFAISIALVWLIARSAIVWRQESE